ncbi:MAG TPA: CxxC-x17-CxxC domain-containing protein [Candidatus Omnitrophota bacterium]|nr:CxxC-x17-CxxC domain-containing protein [Candidatus Omnitrophota bacterium]
MKKSPRSKNRSAAPKVDPYLEGLMAKLLERLVNVEKKLDTVISQTSGRPAIGGNSSAPAQNQSIQQPPRKERTMYEAICADCSKVCEVPFRPSEDRAVYCKTCFANRKAGRPHGMPALTPVSIAPKPVSKLGQPQPVMTNGSSAKTKKTTPAKKTKKKK